MIHYEGFIYTIERTTQTKLIFRCKNRDCKGENTLIIDQLKEKSSMNLARCHTNTSMDAFLSPPTDHCHAPNPERVPAIRLKNEIKTRALTTDESTSTIIHSALRMYPLSAAGQLPKNEALMLMVRRQRTVETLDDNGRLPEKLRKTYRGEDFILYEEKNLIIFTTKMNLSI